MSRPRPLTIVIAVLNEARNVGPVCAELSKIASTFPEHEIIFVNDGSTDDTLAALHAAREAGLPQMRIISHDRRLGKSAALRTGIEAAKGQWIATMDGDGQDDPATVLEMFRAATQIAFEGGQAPIVVGVRRKRRDGISRRIATRFANALRQKLLQDGCPDTGAPMKLFRRDMFLRLPQFEGLHRFLPALFGTYGARLICIETKHRPRLHGVSKYTNFGRAYVGLRDILGVAWLQNRSHLPHYVSEE